MWDFELGGKGWRCGGWDEGGMWGCPMGRVRVGFWYDKGCVDWEWDGVAYGRRRCVICVGNIVVIFT